MNTTPAPQYIYMFSLHQQYPYLKLLIKLSITTLLKLDIHYAQEVIVRS